MDLSQIPKDHKAATTLEQSIRLKTFNSKLAFDLGCRIRSRIQHLRSNASALIVIQIHGNPAFLATTGPGVVADNHNWVARKARTVDRWGCSSWAMGRKFLTGPGATPLPVVDESAFGKKFSLGESAGDYAIHGGAVPVYVEGVEGHVGVAIVSGLAQEEDHMFVIESLQWLETQS